MKVGDVGLVRWGHTITGSTPRDGGKDLLFAAPETQMGERHDERADIFSFGVVLYEIITRREPPPRTLGTKFGFHMEEIAAKMRGT